MDAVERLARDLVDIRGPAGGGGQIAADALAAFALALALALLIGAAARALTAARVDPRRKALARLQAAKTLAPGARLAAQAAALRDFGGEIGGGPGGDISGDIGGEPAGDRAGSLPGGTTDASPGRREADWRAALARRHGGLAAPLDALGAALYRPADAAEVERIGADLEAALGSSGRRR